MTLYYLKHVQTEETVWFTSYGPSNGYFSRGSAKNRGAVAQSVERVTPGEEILGSKPAVAARRPLPTGWVGISIT